MFFATIKKNDLTEFSSWGTNNFKILDKKKNKI